MSLTARWDRDDFEAPVGYTYRNRLTITRPEDVGYTLAGHSSVLRVRARGTTVDLIAQALVAVGSPMLATVNGVPNTLVAVYDLVLTPLQIGTLTEGETYSTVVNLTDSRGETTAVAHGYLYVGTVT